jgi:hypothetical protein
MFGVVLGEAENEKTRTRNIKQKRDVVGTVSHRSEIKMQVKLHKKCTYNACRRSLKTFETG